MSKNKSIRQDMGGDFMEDAGRMKTPSPQKLATQAVVLTSEEAPTGTAAVTFRLSAPQMRRLREHAVLLRMAPSALVRRIVIGAMSNLVEEKSA
ncbi:MAG: hypothetical protein ACO3IN_12860 [Steroidobacteraceae bacterium]|jgi:hypothetical protein